MFEFGYGCEYGFFLVCRLFVMLWLGIFYSYLRKYCLYVELNILNLFKFRRKYLVK